MSRARDARVPPASISLAMLRELLAAREPMVLVDVREEDELGAGVIPGPYGSRMASFRERPGEAPRPERADRRLLRRRVARGACGADPRRARLRARRGGEPWFLRWKELGYAVEQRQLELHRHDPSPHGRAASALCAPHRAPPGGRGGPGEAAHEQGARGGPRRARLSCGALPRGGRGRDARPRGQRHGRGVQPAAPGHPRREPHRDAQGGERPAGDRGFSTPTWRSSGTHCDSAARTSRSCSRRTTWSSTARTTFRHATSSATPAYALARQSCTRRIFRFEGQATTFLPDRAAARLGIAGGPCYRCLYPVPPPADLGPTCQETGVLGVLPGILGVVQATEAIELLLGRARLVGRLLTYDSLEMRFREMRLPRDPSCPACGSHPTLASTTDYEAFCAGR